MLNLRYMRVLRSCPTDSRADEEALACELIVRAPLASRCRSMACSDYPCGGMILAGISAKKTVLRPHLEPGTTACDVT